MFTTRFARGATCCGATLLLVAVFALVAVLHGSQPEFEALSDRAMERLLGGDEKYTQGNLIQSESGSRANCNWPTSCPTEQFVLRPLIYSCFSCEPEEIEYRKESVYKKVTSWCDNSLPTECPYKQFGRGKRDKCNTSLGSYC